MEVKKRSVVLVFLVIVSAFSATIPKITENAMATTLYVGGSGPGNYTTIQGAIDAAFPGDTVFVHSGTYYERVVVDKPLSFVGEDRDTTIVNGTTAESAIHVTSDWVNVTGFTATGTRMSWSFGGGIKLDTVKNCHIANNIASSNDGEGVVLRNADFNSVVNNTIYSNSNRGILISSSDNNTIKGNTISENRYGITLWSSYDNVVENNTVSMNEESGILLQFTPKRNAFTNNSMDGNGFNIVGDTLEQLTSNHVDSSNTVNGKPMYYWKDTSGAVIPSDAGQIVIVNCTNIVIEGQNISNGSEGILVYWSSNITVGNNTLISSKQGILLSHSANSNASNNTLAGNGYGISFSYSNSNVVFKNTISNNRYGISVGNSDDNRIEGNTIASNEQHGISLGSSRNNILVDNVMSKNGIRLTGSSVVYWDTHTIDTTNLVNGKPVQYWKNAVGGIVPAGAGQVILADCDNVLVENQDVSNASIGITLGFSSDNTISNNTAHMSSWYGMRIRHSDRNIVENNTISSSGWVGINMDDSDGNLLINNTVSLNYLEGTELFNSHYNTISGNTVFQNGGTGIRYTSSRGNTISDNKVYSNDRHGISASGSDDGAIANNTVFSNGDYGIFLEDSRGQTLIGNMMTDDGIYVTSFWIDQWNTHTIDTSNVVNGKPVHYWKNVTGGTIPSGAGQVILANCTGVKIETQDVSNGSVGVSLGYSSGNTVNDIISSNNDDGILLEKSTNNIITNNTLSGNTDSGILLSLSSNNNLLLDNNVSGGEKDGILISFSVRNTLSNNKITHNGIRIPGGNLSVWRTHNIDTSNTVNGKPVHYWKDSVGGTVPLGAGQVIFANCTGVVVENQEIINTSVGILLGYSFDNTVIRNSVSSNWYGIYLSQSYDNRIYHNNLADNSNQAYDYGSNNWNDGYPSGGNYWSDYDGNDSRSGPRQDKTGSDGIGDIPLNVPTGLSIDRYPLMSSFVPPPPSPPSAPLALLANAGDGYVNVTWGPPSSDGGSAISSYRIYRGSSPGGETHLTTTGTSLYYNDTDVTNGQVYYYEVAAVNTVGEGPKSNEANAMPAASPGSPTGLVPVSGNSRITLMWSPPNDTGGLPILNYTIYRGTTSGEGIFLAEVGNVLNYTDIGLTNGVLYFYTVSAMNSIGEGPQSDEVNATPSNVLPTCTITDPISGFTVTGLFQISGSAYDSDGPVLTVEVRIDNGSWHEAVGNMSWTYDWDTASVPDGQHMIYARSNDGLDYSEEVSVTVNIDNPAPRDSEQDWLWVAVAVIIILVVVVLLALLILRRKNREPEEQDSPEKPVEEDSET